MDQILRYSELDALSYIDQEYDHPLVKELVDSLVRSEMATFSRNSKNYLDYLTYPSLKFSNSPALQAELQRLSKNLPFAKFDTTRYNVEGPPQGLEKDIQAWKSAVNNAKSQYEHQSNRLLNLELAEKHSTDIWLQGNTITEMHERIIAAKNDQIQNEIQHLNYYRKDKQEKVKSELSKLTRRRDDAVLKSWYINASCHQMEETLRHRGEEVPPFHLQKELRADDEVSTVSSSIEVGTLHSASEYKLAVPEMKRQKIDVAESQSS